MITGGLREKKDLVDQILKCFMIQEKKNVQNNVIHHVDVVRFMMATKQHHTSNTNAGGWNSSDIRNYLNNTFLLTLPDDLQAVISAKPVKATIGGQSNTLQTAEDKIWIPTEKEVFGQITYSGSSENAVNNMYPIFTDAASRVRTQGASGAAVYVWLASPYISNSANFCIVGTSGAPNADAAGNSRGVLPCFRIAPEA